MVVLERVSANFVVYGSTGVSASFVVYGSTGVSASFVVYGSTGTCFCKLCSIR